MYFQKKISQNISYFAESFYRNILSLLAFLLQMLYDWQC